MQQLVRNSPRACGPSFPPPALVDSPNRRQRLAWGWRSSSCSANMLISLVRDIIPKKSASSASSPFPRRSWLPDSHAAYTSPNSSAFRAAHRGELHHRAEAFAAKTRSRSPSRTGWAGAGLHHVPDFPRFIREVFRAGTLFVRR
ncbi:MAG: hypothetical protein ACLSAH_10775 [Bilophila wadsworthia]